MNRADRIAKKKSDKRARKKADMDRNGGQSRYARKFAWLMSNPRPEIRTITRTVTHSDGRIENTVENIEVQRIPWGWEIASPKPWQ